MLCCLFVFMFETYKIIWFLNVIDWLTYKLVSDAITVWNGFNKTGEMSGHINVFLAGNIPFNWFVHWLTWCNNLSLIGKIYLTLSHSNSDFERVSLYNSLIIIKRYDSIILISYHTPFLNQCHTIQRMFLQMKPNIMLQNKSNWRSSVTRNRKTQNMKQQKR